MAEGTADDLMRSRLTLMRNEETVRSAEWIRKFVAKRVVSD
jgi:hypothetical protein